MDGRAPGNGARTPNLHVAVLGCGTVGSAVVRRLRGAAMPTCDVVAVAVRDPERPRDCPVFASDLSTDAVAVASQPGLDVVIEVMGGTATAKAAVEAALQAGTHVVTANKDLLAAHGAELSRLAAAAGVELRYEAAVGGAIPVVRTVRDLLRVDRIRRIEAVLNGTSNYVLERVSSGQSIDAAVGAAQAAGYAEADPSRDLDGRDAAAKLVLLARLAWGRALGESDVFLRGLEGLSARDLRPRADGRRWRLVAVATADGCARVEPQLLSPDHPLANLPGVTNGVVLHTHTSGAITLSGPGAGGDATAAAILADLADVTALLQRRSTAGRNLMFQLTGDDEEALRRLRSRLPCR